MFEAALMKEAATLLDRCKQKNLKITTAESCTGGAIATLLTEIPGCSKSFDRGFITYSNEAKTEMLGVEASLIEMHGAVSEEVAVAMARGALSHSRATMAIAVTGVAGPDGGTPEKPVGMVCIAASADNYLEVKTHRFTGDRRAVRLAGVTAALHMLDAMLRRSFSSVA
jgi:nicotinamide-nucleotide amidase